LRVTRAAEPGGSDPGPSNSYAQILKSSAVIGGAQALVIGVGMVRSKALALMLGPAGFGIMGLYTSIVDLTVSAAGLGISSSGVRQVAAAAAANDATQIERTVSVLRMTTWVLGVLGAVALLALAPAMSMLTFGDRDHAWAIAIVSVAVLFRVVTSGQSALIQGLRRISDLAMMNLLGAVGGLVAAVPLVYFYGVDGIAYSVVAISLIAFLVSTFYSRRVEVRSVKLVGAEARKEVGDLLKLGMAFLASAMMMMGAMYFVRAMIVRTLGLEAAGLYSAAWTLGSMYVGLVLQAMGADFFPRLMGVANDDAQCRRLVNEQTRASLLLAGPGIIATLVFAPLLMTLFYSREFSAGAELLQWICVGMALRVISWPLGFIIVAKGHRVLIVATEFAWMVVNLLLTWMLVGQFGLTGVGIAFFGSYVFHSLLNYAIVRRLGGFRFSRENLSTIVLTILVVGGAFGGFFAFPHRIAMGIGAVAVLVSGGYCFMLLATLVEPNDLPAPFRQLVGAARSLSKRRVR
jgi:enterobacterial common antigen flippase